MRLEISKKKKVNYHEQTPKNHGNLSRDHSITANKGCEDQLKLETKSELVEERKCTNR